MLLRKLWRTLGVYRAQFISMVIMIAIGIGTFVGFNIEWFSLENDVLSFLKDTGFADMRIVRESGFSKEEAEKIAAMDGVDEVSRFLAVNTLEKESSDVIALNFTENFAVSGFIVIEGEAYDEADESGLWLSDRYAKENGFSIGDKLTLVYKNLEIDCEVRGLVKAGEYLVCVPDATQLMPDYSTYGFGYASPALMKRTFGAEFYTNINALTELDKKEFANKADEALGETLLVIGKEDTIQYSEAMGESEEGKTMGLILPVLFLAIAVLTMVTTMHRLCAAEKTQIGTLKSLGFKDRRILRHYSFYALAIGLIGTVLGLLLGWLLGWFIMNPKGAMGTYLDMPSWKLSAPLFVWVVLVVINLLLVLIGFLSVRKMLHGTAADALRPYTPKKMRSIALEKTGLWKVLRFGERWNLRDIFRHKTRSTMTLFGVAGCTILILAALGMQDTMNEFMNSFYEKAIRYELRINLDSENVTNDEAREIAEKYAADTCAVSSVQVNGESYALEIYSIENDTLRFIGENNEFTVLPGEGALICERIAKDHGLKVGDSFNFSPFGASKSYTVRVSGIVRSLSESIVLSEKSAASLGIEYRINTLFSKQTEIAPSESILNTQTKKSIIDSFDTFMKIMHVMIWLLIIAAAVLGVVVLYDLGVMSYVERFREMATLKVIGFKDKKIGGLLIWQNMLLTVVGIILGIPAALGVLKFLVVNLAKEYELRIRVSTLSFIISIALVLGVSLIVALMIARKNKKIDMVEALKAQE